MGRSGPIRLLVAAFTTGPVAKARQFRVATGTRLRVLTVSRPAKALRHSTTVHLSGLTRRLTNLFPARTMSLPRELRAGFVFSPRPMPLSECNWLPAAAQDFREAFALGENDRTIATVDADGVALAAIQGLNQKVEAENKELRAELRSRDAQLAKVQERLAKLEQMLRQLAGNKD